MRKETATSRNTAGQEAFAKAKMAADRALADENITWFSVSAKNFESIYNHSAYARINNGVAPAR